MKEYTKTVNSLFNYRVPFEILIAQRYPGASMAIYDVNSLITDIYNNPTEYLASPANVTGQFSLCDVDNSTICYNTSDLSLAHFLDRKSVV